MRMLFGLQQDSMQFGGQVVTTRQQGYMHPTGQKPIPRFIPIPTPIPTPLPWVWVGAPTSVPIRRPLPTASVRAPSHQVP